MASVFRHPRTRYWVAKFQVWDSKRGEWRYLSKSTRCEDRKQAQAVADGYEKLSLASGPDKGLTKEFVSGVVNDILRIAGHSNLISPSLGAWMEEWLANKVRGRSAGTVRVYRGVLNRFVAALGADLRIDLINEKQIGMYFEKLSHESSKQVANSALRVLRALFNTALKQGHISYNPANRVEMYSLSKLTRMPFTREQFDLLMLGLSSDWRCVAMISRWTGARLGDASQIRWEYVDWEKKLISWYPQKSARLGKHISVPMSQGLEKHLRSLDVLGEGYIVPDLAKHSSSELSRRFRRLLNTAGIVGKEYSFHSLRHTFISELANSGVGEDLRIKLAGHSSPDMNRIYSHFDDGSLRRAIDQMG